MDPILGNSWEISWEKTACLVDLGKFPENHDQHRSRSQKHPPCFNQPPDLHKKKKSKNSLKARHMPLFGILKGANLVVVFLGFASSGRNKHRPADFPFLLHKLIFMETVWKISINKYLHIQQIHSSSKNLPNIDFPTKKTHLQDLKIKHTLFSLAKSKSHIHSTSFSRILQGFPRHISSRPCRRHVIR